ncbi:hypothetical protein [Arthrobacter sp. ok362]|uniref:hypothetical protein n=1 Tax=Arthrobacter sp. ok362 TaxID=1761745 RepID=UPI0008903E21|nr:hypothetical protein [Arthrobacter sp. ok362]SDK80663.1 hypothetical protein SAMN04487913_103241 [Arthrobacter sp. ok362]
MSDYDDYYGNTSPFDEEVESFKAALRAVVKQETQDELETLRTANREMTGKLANLNKLERAAEAAQRDYERKLSQAEQMARRTVEKEGLAKLLELFREPRYRVHIVWDTQPKCVKCDENRKLRYTTPRGNVGFEACECFVQTQRWEVEETVVHEVARRGGKLLVWYHGTSRYFDDDSVGSPTVLKSPDGASLAELSQDPRGYGFPDADTAQELADALNEAKR